jgi:hypothetical protein
LATDVPGTSLLIDDAGVAEAAELALGIHADAELVVGTALVGLGPFADVEGGDGVVEGLGQASSCSVTAP